MEQRRHHRVANEFEFPDGSKGWFDLTIEPSPAGVARLQKPFSPDALVREVRRVLDARPV